MYKPGHARLGDITPQDKPELFTDAEILAEIKYLTRLDNRKPNIIRAAARVKLANFLAERAASKN